MNQCNDYLFSHHIFRYSINCKMPGHKCNNLFNLKISIKIYNNKSK